MKVVCSWCKTTMAAGDESRPPSHGICARCYREYFPELAARRAAAVSA